MASKTKKPEKRHFHVLFNPATIALLLLFLIGSNFSHAQNQEGIDALFAQYNSSDVPGLAVSVLKDGQVVYQKGFGMANLEYGIPIDKKTKFHVASLSKQFTAFLILKLEQEGLLSIKDDVRTYIPELPDYGKTMTIEHLLTHSSGIRDQWRLLEMAGWRLDDVIKTEQIFRLIVKQKELNFPAGERFQYSNSGFTLLAIIVERLTKTSFADYAKQHIFDPLQMGDSFFYDDHEEMMSNRAYSYKKVDGKLKKSHLNFATVGPTSLFTTLEDMSKWAVNFQKMTIGSEKIFQSMNQKGQKKDGSFSSYAKGQFVREYKGLKMIYHSGSDAGYRSYFARFPDIGYQFILFANAAYISSYEEIFKLIDYHLQNKSSQEEDQAPPEEDFAYDESIFVKLSNEEMKKFEGIYFDPEEKHYREVELKNDTLYYKREGGSKSTLHPVGKSNFKIVGTPYDISVNFLTDEVKGPVLEFKVPDIMWLWLFKVNKTDPSDYVGSYYNDELGTQYDLVAKGDELYLTHQKLDDIKVDQITEVYFSSQNRNFTDITFQRDDSGKVTGFSVRNESVKNIVFSKK